MKRILLLSVSLLLLASCKTVAPLISVPRNDSIVIRDRFVRDSIIVRDSIFVRLTPTRTLRPLALPRSSVRLYSLGAHHSYTYMRPPVLWFPVAHNLEIIHGKNL